MGFAGRDLFHKVSLNLNPKERYAITGANGTGKSTFLKVISGEEQATSGTVEAPNNAKIGFLKQDQFKYEDTMILDVVLQGNKELWEALEEKKLLLDKDDLSVDDGMRLGELEGIIAQNDGYTAELKAQEILTGLGIEEDKHIEDMKILSGGFKLRVLLAQTLFGMPDILLLDEPTNHLDIAAICWLEEFLKDEYKGVLLIVSHDYSFLKNLATSILDIDFDTITKYTGNLQQFEKAKTIAIEQKLDEHAQKQRQIDHLQSYVDKNRAKASKAKQAQSRLKMIERIDMPDLLETSRQAPAFKFESKMPSGKDVLKINKISKSFDDNQVLDNVSFTVKKWEKVGIIGQNGIGKSTLLKIIMDKLTADSGEFEWGYNTHISYFAQDHKEVLTGNLSIYDWMHEHATQCDDKTIRGVLGNMLFTQDDAHKKLNNLSGGEAARVLFGYLMTQKANVLVLDEPTNHLDLESINALADSLKAYDGTLLLVSHDRQFLEKICDRYIVITKSGVFDYHVDVIDSLAKLCDKHFLH